MSPIKVCVFINHAAIFRLAISNQDLAVRGMCSCDLNQLSLEWCGLVSSVGG